MPRRWIATVAAVLALVALGCEGGADTGRPGRPPTVAPRPGLPGSMAALGDSITAGFGSCLALTSCHRNSWSTGDGARVDSLYQRLVAVNPALRGQTHNEAVPGARAADLSRQATAAVRAKADYVTILVGANDACRNRIGDMTGVAAFRASLDDALGVLRQGLPKTRVLVVSVPDLYRLWEAGRSDPVATRIWSRGVCPALLAAPTSMAPADVTRRSQFRARVAAYNAELAAACRAYGSRCRYDGGAVHRTRITLDMVNRLDYFHPDVDGQNRLAAVAWRASGLAERVD